MGKLQASFRFRDLWDYSLICNLAILPFVHSSSILTIKQNLSRTTPNGPPYAPSEALMYTFPLSHSFLNAPIDFNDRA